MILNRRAAAVLVAVALLGMAPIAQGGRKMTDIAVKVRVTATSAAELARIAAELERNGLRVRQRLPELGLITGDVSRDRLDALRRIRGVEAVEPEGGVQLPPFDPKVPQ